MIDQIKDLEFEETEKSFYDVLYEDDNIDSLEEFAKEIKELNKLKTQKRKSNRIIL